MSIAQGYSVDNSSLEDSNGTVTGWGPDTAISERLQWLVSQPHQMVALVLSFFAVFLNILCIAAIVKSRSKLTSHFRFILSLAVSDILIGLTVASHIVNKVVNPRWWDLGVGPWWSRVQAQCAFMVIKALNTTSLNISLLNLMAMALDHSLAILKPLHYPQLMSGRRACLIIVLFWLIAFACGFSDFLTVYPSYTYLLVALNYCEVAWLTPHQEEYTMFVIALVCLVVMLSAYVRIFLAVRRRNLCLQSSTTDVAQSKKALFTTLLIIGTFMVCWLPLCLFQVSLIIQVKVNPSAVKQIVAILYKADQYLYDLLLLNAILDPIIYAIRMREVRFGYMRLFWVCLGRYYKGRERSFSTDVSVMYSACADRRVSRLSMNSVRLLENTRRMSMSNGRVPNGRNKRASPERGACAL